MIGNDAQPRLIDPFGRVIDYVRVSLTDKCNFRCSYCLPKDAHGFQPPENYLSPEEIESVIRAFTQLGTRRVRLTGGEPLVRRDALEIIRRLGALPGLEDLSLSTNASLLADIAGELKQAGIGRVNISLDSLQPERFRTMTGGALEPVMRGLMATREAGLAPVKINMVVMKGVNDDEVVEMAEFCIRHGFTLRYIETMPVGAAGLKATDRYLDLAEVKARLAKRYDLVPSVMPGGGPARYFELRGTGLNVGFITPISQHFCDTCNRVRLSVDGTLYLCLGQDHSYPLKPLLRGGAGGDEIKASIHDALKRKPQRHEFREQPGQIVRFMSFTGG